MVELSAETKEALAAKADALEKALTEGDNALAYCCTRVDKKDIGKVWSLRKAGLGLLGGMKGDAKPIGVIEDTAVAPQRLPEYLRDIKKMLDNLGLNCVFYEHISTGELHLRPIIDIKTEKGRRMFRLVAEETARIVRKHRGGCSASDKGQGRGRATSRLRGHSRRDTLRILLHHSHRVHGGSKEGCGGPICTVLPGRRLHSGRCMQQHSRGLNSTC